MGREQNPRVNGVDFKFVCELRPSVIGWCMLNWMLLLSRTQTLKQLMSTPDYALLFICITQTIYALDSFWNEVLLGGIFMRLII